MHQKLQAVSCAATETLKCGHGKCLSENACGARGAGTSSHAHLPSQLIDGPDKSALYAQSVRNGLDGYSTEIASCLIELWRYNCSHSESAR